MVKITKEELKKLIIEALGDVPYKRTVDKTPEERQADEEAYRAKHQARKASKERWVQELQQTIGKIQREIETAPEWNDGTRLTQESRIAILNGLRQAFRGLTHG